MFIRVMFWAFPYLLWQAFGNGSGFIVGVIMAVVLTLMFNNLFHSGARPTTISVDQRASQMAEQRSRSQEEERREVEPYQRGYQAQPYREDQQPLQAWESQSQYEEMQVPYPQQEMPPMEQQQ